MPRIEVDPTRAICPSFEDPEWEFLRQSMVDAHQGDPPLTLDDAAQRLKDMWARENQRKVDAWNVQLQQDLAEQDELDRRTRDAQDVTLQRALLSDLDKGTSFNGKDASAPRCLARPGNAATSNEWRLSPNGWKDEQRVEDGLK